MIFDFRRPGAGEISIARGVPRRAKQGFLGVDENLSNRGPCRKGFPGVFPARRPKPLGTFGPPLLFSRQARPNAQPGVKNRWSERYPEQKGPFGKTARPLCKRFPWASITRRRCSGGVFLPCFVCRAKFAERGIDGRYFLGRMFGVPGDFQPLIGKKSPIDWRGGTAWGPRPEFLPTSLKTGPAGPILAGEVLFRHRSATAKKTGGRAVWLVRVFHQRAPSDGTFVMDHIDPSLIGPGDSKFGTLILRENFAPAVNCFRKTAISLVIGGGRPVQEDVL